jgi:hypothetical protein
MLKNVELFYTVDATLGWIIYRINQMGKLCSRALRISTSTLPVTHGLLCLNSCCLDGIFDLEPELFGQEFLDLLF